MLNSSPKIVAMICLWLCSLAAAGSAQVTTGTIQGHITDPAGAVVPDATITLTNPALAINRRTQSLGDGTFIFPLLRPASGYRIEVEAAGFQRLVIEDLTVRITEVTNANARMALGAVTVTVVVRGDETQPVQTTSPTLGGTLGPEVVAALPLNTRNPLQLLATDAGVASIPGSTTFFVAGQRSTFNNYVLNGVDANNFQWGSLGNVPTPNPDSVREFRVQPACTMPRKGAGPAATSRW